VVHHAVEPISSHVLGAHQVTHHAGIEIAGSRAHDETGRWRETHARIEASAVPHGGDAGAVAQMRQQHSSMRGVRSGEPGQLVEDVLARQAMEPVAPHAVSLVAPRNRQQPGDLRHGVMERGIEARDLRQARRTRGERFDQAKRGWQMLRRVRRRVVELRQKSRADRHGPGMIEPMDDAVAGSVDGIEDALLVEPREHERLRRVRARGVNDAFASFGTTSPGEPRVAGTDPTEVSLQCTCQIGTADVHRQLHARRAGIERQNPTGGGRHAFHLTQAERHCPRRAVGMPSWDRRCAETPTVRADVHPLMRRLRK
jgi:hypothetical protein